MTGVLSKFSAFLIFLIKFFEKRLFTAYKGKLSGLHNYCMYKNTLFGSNDGSRNRFLINCSLSKSLFLFIIFSFYFLIVGTESFSDYSDKSIG